MISTIVLIFVLVILVWIMPSLILSFTVGENIIGNYRDKHGEYPNTWSLVFAWPKYVKYR